MENFITQLRNLFIKLPASFTLNVILYIGLGALAALYLGYIIAHFAAASRQKKAMAALAAAGAPLPTNLPFQKSVGLNTATLILTAVMLVFICYYSAADVFAVGVYFAVYLASIAVLRTVHDILYRACAKGVIAAFDCYRSLARQSANPPEGEPETMEPAQLTVPPAAESEHIDQPVHEMTAEEIMTSIRKLNGEEDTPVPPMTEQEVLENLTDFNSGADESGEEAEEESDIYNVLQDQDFDFEDMDQEIVAEENEDEIIAPEQEPEEEILPEVEPETEETIEPAAPEVLREEEPEAEETQDNPPVAPAAQCESAKNSAIEIMTEQPETGFEELDNAAESEPDFTAQPEPAAEPAAAEKPAEKSIPARNTVLPPATDESDEEIMREIERLKNQPEEGQILPKVKPEVKYAPPKAASYSANELIDRANMAKLSKDDSEESMRTMQQVALLLQKEREKKKRKTPEEQRRMNEALADLLRAIGKKGE